MIIKHECFLTVIAHSSVAILVNDVFGISGALPTVVSVGDVTYELTGFSFGYKDQKTTPK